MKASATAARKKPQPTRKAARGKVAGAPEKKRWPCASTSRRSCRMLPCRDTRAVICNAASCAGVRSRSLRRTSLRRLIECSPVRLAPFARPGSSNITASCVRAGVGAVTLAADPACAPGRAARAPACRHPSRPPLIGAPQKSRRVNQTLLNGTSHERRTKNRNRASRLPVVRPFIGAFNAHGIFLFASMAGLLACRSGERTFAAPSCCRASLACFVVALAAATGSASDAAHLFSCRWRAGGRTVRGCPKSFPAGGGASWRRLQTVGGSVPQGKRRAWDAARPAVPRR